MTCFCVTTCFCTFIFLPTSRTTKATNSIYMISNGSRYLHLSVLSLNFSFKLNT